MNAPQLLSTLTGNGYTRRVRAHGSGASILGGNEAEIFIVISGGGGGGTISTSTPYITMTV